MKFFLFREANSIILSILILLACAGPEKSEKTVFKILSGEVTGIAFNNTLTFDQEFNIYKYRNYYNGGGVALGDVNNDNFPDIYLTANMEDNKLFINAGAGELRYKDITESAGVQGERAWSTGVSMADVNGDGWLDIYVCNSGDIDGDNKQNELFINNGINEKGQLTFTESATEYGLADLGYSTHAAFFDYDKDGDLDMYQLNNSYRPISTFNLRENERMIRDEVGGDKLYRNDGDTFVDVSEKAGIYGSIIGFGMGITIGDLDRDGWQDIYISNDFFEKDYVYMNNGDGTFREVMDTQMKSISATSMGADMADINNDGLMDIFVTEMLPKDEHRLKTKTTFENWDKYQFNLKYDYYHQFTRNTLQLNSGKRPNSNEIFFSEIGRLSGVEATDWSWGALIFDMENDGLKDIFVANGIYKDLTDQDYIQFISNESTRKSVVNNNAIDYSYLVDVIPSNPVPNFAFVNEGNLKFSDRSAEYGLATPSFSNGSAFGDLDNDGDMDLVVNNVNMPAFVYRNDADRLYPENNYIKLELKGPGKNTMAFGTKITAIAGSSRFYLEQMPLKGFQSSVDPRPNLGLGTAKVIDSLIIQWPNDSQTILTRVEVNQTLTVTCGETSKAEANVSESKIQKLLFSEPLEEFKDLYVHKENAFVDFDRDRLTYFMLSTQGPKACVGDVNADGLEDFYIGGAKGFGGSLFVQKDSGEFIQSNVALFHADKASEDTDCLFFDADNDQDLDLYVASGGNEFSNTSAALIDRLYMNDGKGNFEKSPQILPSTRFENTSCVRAADFDLDGDQDLFVGLRMRPMLYGVPANGYLLENDGHGNFSNVTREIAPDLLNYGLFTSAEWSDIDNDKDWDLIVIGEWMLVTIFENIDGNFKNITTQAGLSNSNGWWNNIEAGDFDKDGDMDFVIGNHGLNSRFRASHEKPVSMYINDFDKNGTAEQIICAYNGERSYPVCLKHDLVMQLPHLKKKYLKYERYKGQQINEIFSEEALEKSEKLVAYNLKSSILINKGNNQFDLVPLPMEVQSSPLYALLVQDFDKDGFVDILTGGNLYEVKPEMGRYDASYGHFLKGHASGFTPVSASASGFWVEGQIRDFKIINKNHLMIIKNNAPVEIVKVGHGTSLSSPHRQ